eukprot:441177-Pyramimonas_sp.AAC.1
MCIRDSRSTILAVQSRTSMTPDFVPLPDPKRRLRITSPLFGMGNGARVDHLRSGCGRGLCAVTG